MHTGVDLDKGNNSPIYSFTDGTVVHVTKGITPDSGHINSTDGGSYGNHVIVQDKSGKYHIYAHLNSVNVKDGDSISEGSTLGKQGHTGRSTGSHLHYGVGTSLYGGYMNPTDYLHGYTSTNTTTPSDDGTMPADAPATGFAAITNALNEQLTSTMQPLTDVFGQLSTPLNDIINTVMGTTGSTTPGGSVQAKITGGDKIGDYVKSFESGSSGPNAVSGGLGDHGGMSFGTYQFASFGKANASGGMLDQFWKKYYGSKYPGVQAGSNTAFKEAWIKEANANPEQFAANEWEFMKDYYYKPMLNNIKSVLNPDKHSRAAQEMTWSTAIQYGMNSNVINKALQGKNAMNMTAPELVNAVQNYKSDTISSYFSGSSANVQAGVRNRHNTNERNVLLGLGNQSPIAYGGVDIPLTPKQKELFADTGIARKISELANANNNNKSSIPDSLWDKIIEILSAIAENTGKTTDGIKHLAEKVKQPDNNTTVVTTNNQTVNKNENTNPMFKIASDRRNEITNKNYRTAKLIAQGLN
jgi:hypothetical protein